MSSDINKQMLDAGAYIRTHHKDMPQCVWVGDHSWAWRLGPVAVHWFETITGISWAIYCDGVALDRQLVPEQFHAVACKAGARIRESIEQHNQVVLAVKQKEAEAARGALEYETERQGLLATRALQHLSDLDDN